MISRDEVTPAEILRLLETQSVIRDYKVTSEIEIEELTINSVTFINCEFEKLSFTESPKQLQLYLEDCILNSLAIDPGPHIKKMSINKCKIDQMYLAGSKIDRLLLKSSTFNSIDLVGITSKTIELRRNKINDYLTVYGTIENLITESDYAKDIKITGNLDFIICTGLTKSSVMIYDAEVNYIVTSNIEADSVLRIERTKVNKKISVNEYKQSGFIFDNSEAKLIEFQKNEISVLQMIGDCNCSIEFIGSEQTVNDIILNDSTAVKASDLTFSNLKIGRLFLQELANFGKIEFHNCIISKYFNAFNANLGEMIFSRVTFPPSDKIILNYAYLMDTEFTNVNWNYRINEKFIPSLFEKEDTFLLSVRETYRQLKKVFESQGSKIESLEFRKFELEAHYKSLDRTKFKSWSNAGNFLIVWTNKKGSDYGQNIWRPFILLFAFHLIIFNGFLCANRSLNLYQFNNISCDASLNSMSLYFQTILPTHSTELLPFNSSGRVSISGFWDVLLRVSSSYFIYYFVSASRKFHQ